MCVDKTSWEKLQKFNKVTHVYLTLSSYRVVFEVVKIHKRNYS